MNRKELKKISLDFNYISSRLMQANYVDYLDILAKFLAFIENHKVIYDYITDCGVPSGDIAVEVDEVHETYDVIFTLGDDSESETATIYRILKIIVEKDTRYLLEIVNGYSTSGKYQDQVKSFNDRVVLVLMRHIDLFLTKIGIDMGADEDIRYTIQVHGGQVNLATDNGSVHATQNNGIDTTQLSDLISKLRASIPADFSEDDKNTVNDSIVLIEEQSKQEKPKKRLLNVALRALQGITCSVEFAAAVTQIATFMQTVR